MKKISAIVFDFGGVISSDDDLSDIGKMLAKKYRVSEKRIDGLLFEGG